MDATQQPLGELNDLNQQNPLQFQMRPQMVAPASEQTILKKVLEVATLNASAQLKENATLEQKIELKVENSNFTPNAAISESSNPTKMSVSASSPPLASKPTQIIAEPTTHIPQVDTTAQQTLLSPPSAHTPTDHPQHGNNAQIVTAPFTSPVRPTIPVTNPLASPVPPPSAGKQELNEAAMALTWLAEALHDPNTDAKTEAPSSTNPQQQQHPTVDMQMPYSESVELLQYQQTAQLNKYEPPKITTNLRGRRAASQRCTTVIQNTIRNDRLLINMQANPQRTAAYAEGILAPRSTQQKKRSAATRPGTYKEGPQEKKHKGYSENSRVGRAMHAIVAYIELHEANYAHLGNGGVPERVIRQEYGNNPDTSKALRFLVTEKRVIKKGLGGRKDPFSYILGQKPEVEPEMELSAVQRLAEQGVLFPSPSGNDDDDENLTGAAVNVIIGGGGGGGGMPQSMTPSAVGVGGLNGNSSAAAAAAAAALTAPSTGKWPTTLPRRTIGDREQQQQQPFSRPVQPRLSLGPDSITLPAGNKFSYNRSHPMSALKPPAPIFTASTTSSVEDQAGSASFLSPLGGSGGLNQAPATAVKVAGPPNFTAPTPRTAVKQDHQQQPSGVIDWSSAWPSQLPPSNRLATTTNSAQLASPPPLATTPAALSTLPQHQPMIFLPPNAAAPFLPGATPEQKAAAAQAYLMQLQAAQLIVQQQIAMVQNQQMAETGSMNADGAATALPVTMQEQQQQVPPTAAVAPLQV